MPIFSRRLASQQGRIDMRDPEVTLEILVRATGAEKFDEIAIQAHVYTAFPSNYSGLGNRSIQIEELGNGVYMASCVYKLFEGSPIPEQLDPEPEIPPDPVPPPPPPPPGETQALDETYSFRTGGSTEHIVQSLRTIHRVQKGGGPSYDFKGGIGYNQGRFEGCDRYMPKLEFSMTRTVPRLSTKYVKLVRDLTGTVNSLRYYNHDPGELLFLGASGQTRSSADGGGWIMTFDFAEAENLVLGPNTADANDPLVIIPDSAHGAGDGLVVPSKDGWDFLWVLYEPTVQAGKWGREPVAAYVERVFKRTNFFRMKL